MLQQALNEYIERIRQNVRDGDFPHAQFLHHELSWMLREVVNQLGELEKEIGKGQDALKALELARQLIRDGKFEEALRLLSRYEDGALFVEVRQIKVEAQHKLKQQHELEALSARIEQHVHKGEYAAAEELIKSVEDESPEIAEIYRRLIERATDQPVKEERPAPPTNQPTPPGTSTPPISTPMPIKPITSPIVSRDLAAEDKKSIDDGIIDDVILPEPVIIASPITPPTDFVISDEEDEGSEAMDAEEEEAEAAPKPAEDRAPAAEASTGSGLRARLDEYGELRRREASGEKSDKSTGEAAAVGGAASASDGVQFSAYHPKTVKRDDWQPLYAYVFRPSAAQAVINDALKALGQKYAGYGTAVKSAPVPVQQGAVITARPKLTGFRFRPLSLEVEFAAAWERFNFEISASADAPLNQFATGSITFSVEGVIIADVPLSVYVGDETQMGEIANAVSDLYQTIFCSYSRRDSAVVERVERAYRALGLNFLRDIHEIRSGQEWNPRLLEMIDQADIFQLFWSQAAADSPYVRQEWMHALKHEKARPAFIRPVYWQQPIPSVPSELSHIHFAYEPALGG